MQQRTWMYKLLPPTVRGEKASYTFFQAPLWGVWGAGAKPEMIMIKGISHITLIVKDIDKTASLFKNIFGAREVYSSGENSHSVSKEKFLMIHNIWFAIMEGDPILEKSYNHIAFRISENDFDSYAKIIAEAGLETIKDRKRIAGEGKSIYFYDNDNHLFELHTGSLDERLKHYSK